MKVFCIITLVGLFISFIGFTVNETARVNSGFFRILEKVGLFLMFGGGLLVIGSFILTFV